MSGPRSAPVGQQRCVCWSACIYQLLSSFGVNVLKSVARSRVHASGGGAWYMALHLQGSLVRQVDGTDTATALNVNPMRGFRKRKLCAKCSALWCLQTMWKSSVPSARACCCNQSLLRNADAIRVTAWSDSSVEGNIGLESSNSPNLLKDSNTIVRCSSASLAEDTSLEMVAIKPALTPTQSVG